MQQYRARWIMQEELACPAYCPTDDTAADALANPLLSAMEKHFAASPGLRAK
jgi:hypothetical protein